MLSSAKQELAITIFDNLNIQSKIFCLTYLVHANHLSPSVLHKHCKMQTKWNYGNIVTITQVFILRDNFLAVAVILVKLPFSP